MIGKDSGTGVILNDDASGGNDALSGDARGNTIDGGRGDDVISGLAGNDVLIGGFGTDTLKGGAGADVFDFNSAWESLPGIGIRDVISDFKRADGDKIDLDTIDANALADGDQSFTPIAGPFTTAGAQLKFTVTGANTLITGNIDNDTAAEFAILVLGITDLNAGDIIL